MIGSTWILLVVVLVLTWTYSWWKHRYWATKGVQTPPILPVLGHYNMLLPNSRIRFEDEVYKKYGGDKFCGLFIFHKPAIMIGDPDLLKHILVKDFDYFTDRQTIKVTNKKDKAMANMLTMKTGEEWKRLRAIMSPTFTSGKMKSMFPLVCKKADELVAFCLNEAKKKPSIDMKFNFGRFTMDTIASCAFGIECNSLVEQKPIFATKVEEFFTLKIESLIRIFIVSIFPKFAALIGLRVTTKTGDFFLDVATETLAARRKGEKRGDFLDLLLEARLPTGIIEKNAEDSNSIHSPKTQALDDLTIVSQSVLFLVAGYDTTASTLAFASYFLSKNPGIQKHLRREMQDLVEEHGDITYQGVMEAKYLDSVLMDVTIEPGTVVMCPMRNIHRDPKYWPEPEEFRPERFLPENKANITSFTHMPFGMGPRNCLAMRFALMEAKVALAKLLLASELALDPGFELKVEMGLGIQRPAKGVSIILNPLKKD